MQQDGDKMLKVEVISKAFAEQKILDNCELQLNAGDRLSILGSSGIGKSTLLRIIAGLDTDYKGEVKLPKTVTYMFQEPNLLSWRNCYQNLLIFHRDASKEEAKAVLEKVGLSDKGHHYPRQLSLGQQRRLALARTFLSKTDLVLLDEPFTSLDPKLKVGMLELTRNLLDQSGATLIHVTHDVTETKYLGTQTVEMIGQPATLNYRTNG